MSKDTIHLFNNLSVKSIVANGSVSGITTLSAGNTTITGYANVSSTLQVGTNTSTFGTAAYIVANGNVGIGTNSPGGKLQISDASNSVTPLIIDSGAGTDDTRGIALNVSGSNYGRILVPSGSGGAMAFWAGGAGVASERMRIAANGNIGIGTTSPQSKMEIRATSSGAVFDALTLSNYVNASVGTGVALHFDPNGAGSLLRTASIKSVQTTSGNYADLRFFTANGDVPAERMQIAANGKVGIGTTIPGYLLSVIGSDTTNAFIAGATKGVRFAFNSTTSRIEGVDGTGAASYQPLDINGSIVTTSISGTETVRIDSTGNMGIGTSSPGGKLDVTGSLGSVVVNGAGDQIAYTFNGFNYLTASGAAATLQIQASGASGKLTFATAGSERMRIGSSGNIGFNSTNLGGGSGAYRFAGNVTGATTSVGILYTPTVSSDVTGIASVFLSQPSTQAAAFTLGDLRHFQANQGTFGATSSVTYQYGFYVNSTLTGATNNYAFYGAIASGTGRWNLYMAGTADNYLAGNVGIGTTSPGAKLDAIGVIRSKNASGDVGGLRLWSDVSGNGNIFEYYNASLIFGTGDTERMRIDSSGNVGIGTSGPTKILSIATGGTATPFQGGMTGIGIFNTDLTTSGLSGITGYLTDPGGTNRHAGAIAFGKDGTWTVGAAYPGYIGFWTRPNSTADEAERMRIAANGNVGIGTNSPVFPLDVQGSANTAAGFIRTYNANTGSLATTGAQFQTTTVTGIYLVSQTASIVGTTTAHPLAIYANNTTVGYFAANGNFGVGWSTPAYKVQAAGVISSQVSGESGFRLYNMGATAEWFIGQRSNTSHNLTFSKVVSSTYSDYITLETTGNVGVGTTSPGCKLDVKGNSTTDIFHVTAGTTYFTAGVTDGTQVELNSYQTSVGVKRLAIQSAGGDTTFGGTVGVGTASPQSKMEIRATSGGSVFNALTLSNYVGASVGTGVALYFDPNGAGSLARAASIQSVQSTSGNYADLRFFTSNSDVPAERLRIDVGGGVSIGTTTVADSGGLLTSGNIRTNGGGGIGYATGAGGTVVQTNTKSDAVTLNKYTGQITMNAESLAAGGIVTFQLNNTTLSSTDMIVISHQSGGTIGAYTINGRVSASFTGQITVRNNTAGALAEAIVLKFIVVKSVTA